MEDVITTFRNLLNQPISFEVELTSRCNSRCVGCSRLSEFYYPNPYYKANTDLPKELLFKALEAAPQIEFILFCGNYGDPLLHPEILDILKYIRTHRGDLRVSIHSNAAFGRAEFWQELAQYFQTKGSSIKFSIDGFKDSHEKFRRGTQWERAVQNAETFIAAGGRAVWKAIEFDHNRHEMKALESLAKEKGFLNFDLRKNNYPGLDEPIVTSVDLKFIPDSVHGSPLSRTELQTWNTSQIASKTYDSIQCKSLERANIFLDAHGDVWPCCWIGGLPYRPEHELRELFNSEVLKRFQPYFNSLKHHALDEILKHAWLGEELEQSWQNKADDNRNPLLSTCAKTCGKCLSA